MSQPVSLGHNQVQPPTRLTIISYAQTTWLSFNRSMCKISWRLTITFINGWCICIGILPSGSTRCTWVRLLRWCCGLAKCWIFFDMANPQVDHPSNSHMPEDPISAHHSTCWCPGLYDYGAFCGYICFLIKFGMLVCYFLVYCLLDLCMW